MLSQHALLITLTICQWSNSRVDKKVTREISEARVGQFNKNLIDPMALKPISSKLSLIRNIHYNYTLPWQNRQSRILPARAYVKYMNTINHHKKELDYLVKDFVERYPSLIESSKARLKEMFQEEDYPPAEKLKDMFDVTVVATPFDTGDLFKMLQIPDEEREKLVETTLASDKEKLLHAHFHMWERLREKVHRFVVISKEGKRIHQSLFDSLGELLEIIPCYSDIIKEPALYQMVEECKELLIKYTADDFRSRKNGDAIAAREEACKEAEALLNEIERRIKVIFSGYSVNLEECEDIE